MESGTKSQHRERASTDDSSISLIDEDAGRYGYGKCEPEAIQCGNNPKGFLATYCFFVVVQGMLVNGFINVSISTLERRFGFKSSETAVISTGYDIAFCVLTMFVTYFGARYHRPRLIAIGCFIMGLGAMIFWLPHFTTPNYEYTNEFSDVCIENNEPDCEGPSTSLHNYLYLFIFAQLLHGVGCTPLYTLGLSFIEDTVSKEAAPVYLGIGNGASIFGPVLGYGLGGLFLGIYVDIDSVDMDTVEIDSSDPRWVGAWWLGMMISMICAWLICIPLFGFPKEFSGTAKIRAIKASQKEVPVDGGEEIASRENFGKSIKDFPVALLTLAKNSTYVFATLSGCSEAMVISGFTTFLPKIIENQFQVSAGLAGIVAGVISIPGGIVGHILAGFLVRRFKMKTPTIFKTNIIYCLLVCVGAPCLLLACDNQSVAGITTPYNGENSTNGGNLITACNQDCSCQEEFFINACGIDNINYFTACHAGCTNSSIVNDTTYYYNCSCIDGALATEGSYMASAGACESNCGNLPAFLGIFFVVVLFTFMSNTPTLVVTFRVVPENMRSFALGVQWLFIRALGSIPGPIMFGSIIDLTCILWQVRQCDESRGSCWIHDSMSMTINVTAISVACKLLSSIFFFLGWFFYKPPPKSVDESELKKQTEIVNEAFDGSDSSDTAPSSGFSFSNPSTKVTDDKTGHFSSDAPDYKEDNTDDEPVTAL